MSIEIVEFTILERVASQMEYSSQGAAPSVYRIPICRRMQMEEITRLVTTWHRLNVETYNIYYPQEKKPIADLPTICYHQHPLPPIQFIKWITYIEGFISGPMVEEVRPLTPQEAHALTTLSKVIRGAMESVIINLPEYEKAKWPDE